MSTQNPVDNAGLKDFKSTDTYRYTLLWIIAIAAIIASFAVVPINAAIHRFTGLYEYWDGIIQAFPSLPIFPVYKLLTEPLIVMFFITAFSIWAIMKLNKGGKGAILPLCLILAELLLVVALNVALFLEYEYMKDLNLDSMGMQIIVIIVKYLMLSGIALYLILALKNYLGGTTKQQRPARRQISGIGFWLVIGAIRIISYILNFAFSFAYTMNRSIGELFADNYPEFLSKNPLLIFLSRMGANLVDYSYTFLVLFTAFGTVIAVMTAVKLFKKDLGFKAYAITLEGLNLLMALFAILYWSTIGWNNVIESWPKIFICSNLPVAVWSFFFMLYYSKSDRVRNTFVK